MVKPNRAVILCLAARLRHSQCDFHHVCDMRFPSDADMLHKPLITETGAKGPGEALRLSSKVPAPNMSNDEPGSRAPAGHMDTLDDEAVEPPWFSIFACFSCAMRPTKKRCSGRNGESMPRPAEIAHGGRMGFHSRGKTRSEASHMEAQGAPASGGSARDKRTPSASLHWWGMRSVAAR
jgi:hypothetical protein